MSAAEISQIIASLEEMASVLDALGVPGLISLALLGPFAVFVTMLVLDHHRNRRIDSIIEGHRIETGDLVEKFREDTGRIMEMYREDTQKMLHEMDLKHAEVSRYYEDNVELLKTTQQLAEDLREIVTYNSRVMERVVSLAENNMFCPLAREHARGSK